ncbi:MAG: exodeoxyribonuclease VII small subunit [Pseudomonadota bacterium]
MTTQPEIGAMNFEDALRELEGLVDRLDRGDVPLEQSIALYERGQALKAHCEAKLRDAEERVAKITAGPDGKVTGTTPLDAG